MTSHRLRTRNNPRIPLANSNDNTELHVLHKRLVEKTAYLVVPADRAQRGPETASQLVQTGQGKRPMWGDTCKSPDSSRKEVSKSHFRLICSGIPS